MAQTAVHPALSDRYVSRSDNSYKLLPTLLWRPLHPWCDVTQYPSTSHTLPGHYTHVGHIYMSVSAIPWQVYLIVTTQHGTLMLLSRPTLGQLTDLLCNLPCTDPGVQGAIHCHLNLDQYCK
jgi:hypothetical protein